MVHDADTDFNAIIDRLAKEISDKIHPNRPRSSINWRSIGRITLIIGGTVILTTANVASGAVIEGGGEFIDEHQDGEPINWGAVAAGTVGIATAEDYLHSAAKGDVFA